MRVSIGLLLMLAASPSAQGQIEPDRRFGLKQTLEIYQQDSPRKTLASLTRALDKGRYDYIVAFLIDPAFIDEQIRQVYPTFETRARAQVQKEAEAGKGYDREFTANRIKELATQASFNHIVARVREHFDNDPENVKALRRMVNAGEFNEGADVTSVKLNDVKDKTLFIRKAGDRWYLENRIQEDKP
jgi:hypothetical protein